ncbi:hypothetical protein CCM_08472 [Cordyceps militaris CM01]|uniref:Uncharacterized protein n=1 Tax=Cordyceps militaris (strain CM01) TaxID=983644 RepID=G3JRN8_CORMM|nr:uncharacterized protein CCM_08472 [Cordyceps militaris CM01]EGX88428.1 hypothetical protein CCM_08472 [Cordyceps militaris CM01]
MPPLNNTPVIYCMIPGAGDEGRHFFPTEASRVDRDVVDLIEHQPPAFYLRSQWPAEILIPEAADEVEGHNTYGQVPNCFELPDEEYSLHLAYIHALYRGVFKGAWATGTGLQAFLKIVVRGQEHCTAVIDNEFRVLGYPIPQVWISERDVNGIYKGHEFCPGTTPWNAEHAQAKFNRDLKGRRFWVAVFNFTDPRDIHSGRHWAVTIFDRRASCLLYIDSVEVSRGERARSAAIMWRQFLHNLYLPYKFLLIVPPMTPQDNEWASGYLAVFEALLILRGIEVDAGRASPGTDEYVNVLTSRCELHWADWSNLGFTGKAAIKAMKNVMIKVMANELGVERGMKGEDGGYHNINFEDFKTMDLTSLRTISAAKIMELQAKIDAANERLRAAGLEEVRNEGIKLAPQPDFAREFREAAQDKVKWTEDWIERANPMKQAVSPDPDHCSEHLSQLGLEPTEDDGYSTLRVDTERVQGAEFVPMSREIWAGIMAKNEARERKNKRLSLTTAWPRELYPARREPTGFYTNSHGSVIDLVPDGLMDLRAWTEVYERFRSQGVDRTRQAEEREARHERRAQRQDGGQPRGGNPTS